MVVYYHYTNKSGRDGIIRDKFIQQSSTLDKGDDAFHGNGVYFTDLPPSSGKQVIARLCWGPNAGAAMVNKGRVDYAFQITFASGQIKKATKEGVYLYEGDLDLNDFQWEVVAVPN